MNENQIYEKKSLRFLDRPDWNELAKDCVCFANAKGGSILIGVEDNIDTPPANQKIEISKVEEIRKRISELTIGVGTNIELKKSANDSEYIEIKIFPNVSSVASTTDGRYYIRIADDCKPVLPVNSNGYSTTNQHLIGRLKLYKESALMNVIKLNWKISLMK
jgi:ATP-dependent DNA helicase RecG